MEQYLSTNSLSNEIKNSIIYKNIYETVTLNKIVEYVNDDLSGVTKVSVYNNYFKSGNRYIVKFKTDEFPTFEVNDLIRCQKYSNNDIKYYDGLILSKIDNFTIMLFNQQYLYLINIQNSI